MKNNKANSNTIRKEDGFLAAMFRKYDYDPRGGFLYRMVCRDFYYYEPTTVVGGPHNANPFVLLGVVLHWLNSMAIWVIGGVYALKVYNLPFLLAIFAGLVAAVIWSFFTGAHGFIGEFFTKLEGLIVGTWASYLAQLFLYDELVPFALTGADLTKMVWITIGVYVVSILSLCMYWKSCYWAKGPETFLGLTHLLQRGREKYIAKIERKLGSKEYGRYFVAYF